MNAPFFWENGPENYLHVTIRYETETAVVSLATAYHQGRQKQCHHYHKTVTEQVFVKVAAGWYCAQRSITFRDITFARFCVTWHRVHQCTPEAHYAFSLGSHTGNGKAFNVQGGHSSRKGEKERHRRETLSLWQKKEHLFSYSFRPKFSAKLFLDTFCVLPQLSLGRTMMNVDVNATVVSQAPCWSSAIALASDI